ncbi:MAG TPA: hypothetical protein VFE16_03050 [Candidatus Cybelea sp.]|jgi:hypothetical protein|nr:hypothetical protein [Candidatus Cybelea sp.]
MAADAALTELVARVGAFHITQRAMVRAQRAIEAAIRAGSVDEAARAAYVAEVQRYFDGFDAEARTHLRDVDRRLERANQVHFNLAAERGVAVKRIEATQAVRAAVAALERNP